jgi:transcriptional regulator with XRE-family HTH domain
VAPCGSPRSAPGTLNNISVSSLNNARESFGRRLREVRETTGKTGKELAEDLGWDPAKVSRFETGKRLPSRTDLLALTAACNQPGAADELLAQLSIIDDMYAAWRRQFRAGFGGRQRASLAVEAHTRLFRIFECALVPGLLQTPEYARLVYLKLVELYGFADDVEEVVALRMERQRVLYQPGHKFHFVLTETVLRQSFVPPDVMRAQIDRLISASTLKDVAIGVVPLDVVLPAPPWHGFWLFDDRLVQVETVSAELSINEPDEIKMYGATFKVFADCAVYGQAARTRLIDLQQALV